MAHAAPAMRQINIRVTEKVYVRLEKLAHEGQTTVSTMVGLLFDAAYAARVKGTPDADLDAHVAMVGLATMGAVELDQIAVGTGLSPATVDRMQEAWKSVLLERRRAG